MSHFAASAAHKPWILGYFEHVLSICGIDLQFLFEMLQNLDFVGGEGIGMSFTFQFEFKLKKFFVLELVGKQLHYLSIDIFN